MEMRRMLTRFSTFIIVSTALVGIAQAAPINYGDFAGSSVMYLDVTESSSTDDGPLYFGPNVSSEALDFDPMQFGASGSNGAIDITDGQLNLIIMTNSGVGLTNLIISEWGDYSFFGGPNTSSATAVMINQSIRIEVLEVDNKAIDPYTVTTFNSTGADFSEDGPGIDGWSISTSIDLTSQANGFDLGVTKLKVVIDNQLIAGSEDGSLAFVSKKDFKIFPENINIPEPMSALLLLLGVAFMGIRR